MSKLYCMITITDRSRVNEYLRLFNEHDVPVGLVTMGEGTASTELQELFGLQSVENEKAVCFFNNKRNHLDIGEKGPRNTCEQHGAVGRAALC